MKKSLLTILSLLLLLATSSAHAFHGTFVSNRNTSQGPVLDQFVFEEGGTGYWFQSTFITFPDSGTSTPEVGTWKLKGDNLILTTIGAATSPDDGDFILSAYTRSTQKFKVLDKNAIQIRHRVFREIDPTQNPISSEGAVILNSFDRFDAEKVQVKSKDLKI